MGGVVALGCDGAEGSDQLAGVGEVEAAAAEQRQQRHGRALVAFRAGGEVAHVERQQTVVFFLAERFDDHVGDGAGA